MRIYSHLKISFLSIVSRLSLRSSVLYAWPLIVVWHGLLRKQWSWCLEISDERGNLSLQTLYRIRSLNSNSVGPLGRWLLFFLFSFLINAKLLVKIFMTRDGKNRHFLLKSFLCFWLGFSDHLSFLCSFFFPLLHFFQPFHSSISIFSSLLIYYKDRVKYEARKGRRIA